MLDQLGTCIHLEGEADAYTDETYEAAYARLYRYGCDCGWLTSKGGAFGEETITVYHTHKTFTIHYRSGYLTRITYTYGEAGEVRTLWKVA